MNIRQPDVAEKFERDLLPGEKLLWSGQPLTRIIFHKQDWTLIPFSLMWGGFAIFWEAGASGFGKEGLSFFTLWGIPFVVIGQYLIWGRFMYAAWRKRRTFYALTNRRVIVLFEGISRTVTEGQLATLPSTSIEERSDGAGSIDFSGNGFSQLSNFNQKGNSPWSGNLGALAFMDIPIAREVYRDVVQARNAVVGTNTGSLPPE